MVKRGPLSVFRGKQGYMYAVALLAWANYTEYQKEFAGESSLYTVELADEQTAAIEAARQQPNERQRREVPKDARDLLNKNAGNLRAFWQLLSSLIEKAFTPDLWEGKKLAAGSNYYLQSSNENWSATFDMGDTAATFLAENSEALTAGGMLPNFPGRFTAAKKEYDDVYSTYYTTKQGAKDGTKKKAAANTSVYKTTISMMKDGVKIFRNNPDVGEKFVYNSLMKLVAGKGFIKTSYHFILKDAATGLPITAATVVFTATDGTPYPGRMGKTGNLRCDLPAGTYGYVLKAPGYSTLIGTVKAIEGSARQKTLHLIADTGTSGFTSQSKVG